MYMELGYGIRYNVSLSTSDTHLTRLTPICNNGVTHEIFLLVLHHTTQLSEVRPCVPGSWDRVETKYGECE